MYFGCRMGVHRKKIDLTLLGEEQQQRSVSCSEGEEGETRFRVWSLQSSSLQCVSSSTTTGGGDTKLVCDPRAVP